MNPQLSFRFPAGFLALAAVLVLGCDKEYQARVDVDLVGTPNPRQAVAQAEEVFLGVARRHGLECRATAEPLVLGTYAEGKWSFLRCEETRGSYTEIMLAKSADRAAVELYDLSEMEEPRLFKTLRLEIVRGMERRFGKGRVRLTYPYRY